MKLLLMPMLMLLTACQTQVWHPTKNAAEQKRDVQLCEQHGKLTEPVEPVAALNVAFECLEAKGYRKGRAPSRSIGG